MADCDAALRLVEGPAKLTEKRKRRASSMATKLARRASHVAMASLAEEDAAAAVGKLKAKGNAAFKKRQWSEAAECYEAGVEVLGQLRQRQAEQREKQQAAERQSTISGGDRAVRTAKAWAEDQR